MHIWMGVAVIIKNSKIALVVMLPEILFIIRPSG